MFYKTDTNGNRVPLNEGGNLANIEVVTAAKTLSLEESGKTCILSAAEGVAITLPATESAWNFKFITGLAFGTSSWVITADSTVIQGNVLVAGAHVAGADADTITFVHSADSVGDYAEVVCDGTNIYVSGSAVTSGAITLTDES